MAALFASSNWVSCVSPAELGATSAQSSGSQCALSPVEAGLHDHSCGPAVALRAAKRRPPNATRLGTALLAGSMLPRFGLSTVTDVFADQACAEGVAFTHEEQLELAQGAGGSFTARATPPLLAA